MFLTVSKIPLAIFDQYDKKKVSRNNKRLTLSLSMRNVKFRGYKFNGDL